MRIKKIESIYKGIKVDCVCANKQAYIVFPQKDFEEKTLSIDVGTVYSNIHNVDGAIDETIKFLSDIIRDLEELKEKSRTIADVFPLYEI